jgi:hypothetical protein
VAGIRERVDPFKLELNRVGQGEGIEAIALGAQRGGSPRVEIGRGQHPL